MSTQITNDRSSGLTLVEVLVVAPIVIIVIGIFISTIVYLTGDVISSRVSSNQSYMIQDALDRIEQDVKYSTRFLATNSITPLTSPQGYNDVTADFDNVSLTTKPMLILDMFAISKPPLDNSRNILYIPNTPNACASIKVSQNTPLMFNIVYFVNASNQLVRRVIAPSNYATACDPSTGATAAPWQIPSCRTYNLGVFCKTADEVLVTGLMPASTEGFIVKYFESGSVVEATNSSNSGVADAVRQVGLDLADMATVTVNTSITSSGREVNDSGTIRATKYNLND